MFEEVLRRVFKAIERDSLNFTLPDFHFQLKVMSLNWIIFDLSGFLGLPGIKWKVLYEDSCHSVAMDIHQIVA